MASASKTGGTMDIINMLPELRERIFNYLVHSDILQFACSCKDAYNLTKYLLFHTVSISGDYGNTSAFDGILKNIEFVKNISMNVLKRDFHAPLTDNFVILLENFSVCSRLTALKIIGFKIKQKSMAHIWNITSLVQLDLSQCDISDVSFNRDLTEITGVGIQLIGKVITLQDLNLSACKGLLDGSLKYFHLLTSLKKLDLSRTEITGVGMQYICKVASLEDLNLSDCRRLCHGSLQYLHSLTSLKKLDVGYRKITNVEVQHISRMISLQDLNLSHCKELDDGSLQYLHSLTSLKKLDVSHTDITNVGVQHISWMVSLEDLNLCYCHELDDGSLQYLHLLPSLKKLDVNCTSITRDAASRLISII